MSINLENNSVSTVCGKLYLNAELADVQFVFDTDGEPQKLPANKAILAVQSAVFNRMFFGQLKEKGDVIIVDFEVDEFKEFLQFFYLSKITLTIENIGGVVRLADKYDILNRLTDCIPYLYENLISENMCCGYELALQLNNVEFIDFCEDDISYFTRTVYSSDAFLACSKNTLERILNIDLSCRAIDIFKAVLEWAKFACKKQNSDGNQATNLRAQLGDCLKLVPFNKMKIGEFSACYKSYTGLFTPEEFEDIVLMLTTDYEPKVFCPIGPQYKMKEGKEYFRALSISRPLSFVEDKEIVRFTVNQPVLLGTIFIQRGQEDKNYSITSVVITEFLEQNSDYLNKSFYETTGKWNSKYTPGYTLPNPFLLKSWCQYEIQLNIHKNGEVPIYSYEPSVETKPNDLQTEFDANEITINYIQSSSVKRDILKAGAVKGFKLCLYER